MYLIKKNTSIHKTIHNKCTQLNTSYERSHCSIPRFRWVPHGGEQHDLKRLRYRRERGRDVL